MDNVNQKVKNSGISPCLLSRSGDSSRLADEAKATETSYTMPNPISTRSSAAVAILVLVLFGLFMAARLCHKAPPSPEATTPLEATTSPEASPEATSPVQTVESPSDAPLSMEVLRQHNREAVARLFETRQKEYAGNPDALVHPGLVALREGGSGRVEIDVQTTEVALNSIVEFGLIVAGTGHDYESLFESFASAKHIDEALKFLGMTPGRNAYAKPMDFWPKGEHVMVSLKGRGGAADIPLESLVLDRRDGAAEGATLPVRGFVYCGSLPAAPDPERKEKDALAADYDGPCSILSTYNEPTTLLDVPRKASQNEVYESFLATPAPNLKVGDLVTLVLAPESRSAAEGPRVVDLALHLYGTPNGLRCLLAKADGTETREAELATILKGLSAKADRFDQFVTLDWADAITFGDAAAAAALLDGADAENGIRIEAPRDGQPYYRAFLPDSDWLDRAKRPTQPLELRFAKDDSGTLTATLVSVVEIWPEDGSSLDPELKATDIPVPSVEALPALAAETANEIPALLIYAPASATLGEVLPFVRTLQKTRPNVYFFVEGAKP